MGRGEAAGKKLKVTETTTAEYDEDAQRQELEWVQQQVLRNPLVRCKIFCNLSSLPN